MRGPVDARPWGATLAELVLSGRRAQLTVRAATGAVHAIAFARGAIVGATSPVAADAAARIAVTSRIATRTQVEAFAKSRRGSGDELDALIAALGLGGVLARELRQRVLLQRAARTFAIERGEYLVEERIAIPVMSGTDVDVRAVVYHGARLLLHGDRLAKELRELGSRFVLTATTPELARFGFGDEERPVLGVLREGASIAEIEARRRDLDPRMVQAVVYALATCKAMTPAKVTQQNTEEVACVPMLIRADPEVAVPPQESEPPQLPPPPPLTPRPPVVAAHTIPRDRLARSRRDLARGTRRWTEPFLEVRTTTMRPNALSAHELRALIAAGSEMLEQSVDHFTMLGVPIGASVADVRAAYVELARNLKPERLAELQIRDQEFHARALLAQICIAYTVLTDPARRAEYIAGLRRSRGAAEIDFMRLAGEAFERGERALRAQEPDIAVAELRTACELAPDNIDYLALLARAEFSARAVKRD